MPCWPMVRICPLSLHSVILILLNDTCRCTESKPPSNSQPDGLQVQISLVSFISWRHMVRHQMPQYGIRWHKASNGSRLQWLQSPSCSNRNSLAGEGKLDSIMPAGSWTMVAACDGPFAVPCCAVTCCAVTCNAVCVVNSVASVFRYQVACPCRRGVPAARQATHVQRLHCHGRVLFMRLVAGANTSASCSLCRCAAHCDACRQLR